VTLSKDGKTYQVAAGWDRPLQDFFVSILPLDDISEEDEDPVLDHLAQLETLPYLSGEQMGTALAEAGLALPEAMVKALNEDFLANAGNVMRSFSPTGELLESYGHAPATA
jgi:hypothetical protein